MRVVTAIALSLVVAAGVTPSFAAASSAADRRCQFNQPCAHHGTTYRVTKVRVASTLGSGYFKETTSGVFVIVTVKMTNTKDRPSTIMSTNLALKARTGDKYEVTSKALGQDDAFVLLEELQPKLPQQFRLIYEVPKSAPRGASLEISDLGSGDKARISLRS